MFRLKSMQDKKGRLVKRLIVLTLVTCFLCALLATTNAFASISGQKPTGSLTTTVIGVDANIIATPVTINGHSFTKSNIHDYPIRFSNDGTVSLCLSNFLPGDYVQFAVTIRNTGSTTLSFQPYAYSFYFVTGSGTMMNPPYPSPITGYPAPISIVNRPWTLANFGTDTLSAYISKYLAGSQSTNWVIDFSYTKAATLPATLAPGATFTYNLYVGLGSNVPYGIPNYYFSLNIPLVSTPSPTPTHPPCPTATPKPTPTHPPCPTPTHIPCPTVTPKPHR